MTRATGGRLGHVHAQELPCVSRVKTICNDPEGPLMLPTRYLYQRLHMLSMPVARCSGTRMHAFTIDQNTQCMHCRSLWCVDLFDNGVTEVNPRGSAFQCARQGSEFSSGPVSRHVEPPLRVLKHILISQHPPLTPFPHPIHSLFSTLSLASHTLHSDIEPPLDARPTRRAPVTT